MKGFINKSYGSIIFLIFTACLLHTGIIPASSQEFKGKIALFGSSVANGSGDTTGRGGYAGMLKALLESGGWEFVNLSKGGDNTTKILPRFESQLLPQKPGYVIIGLSLGNEGITSSNPLARERTFERFRSGILRLVRLCRENGMTPVIVNCYTRMDFGPEQYEAVRRMNLLISEWEVPSVNVLGTIDDGSGHWVKGFEHDRSHPNVKGHREMFSAFVPSLFDALATGKKAPEKPLSKTYALVRGPVNSAPLAFIPGDSLRSFSMSFVLQTTGNGALARVGGADGLLSVNARQGKLYLETPSGCVLRADTSGENRGWQYVVLTYQRAMERVAFYVNGRFCGNCSGLFRPGSFFIGGPAVGEEGASPAENGYRDLMIWRSALNQDEITKLYHGGIIRSSLEIYSPLNDSVFPNRGTVINLAQSLSSVKIAGEGVTSATDEKTK